MNRDDDIGRLGALGKLCDYCAREAPTVSFEQKRSFTMILDGVAMRYEDPWLACPVCARLVVRKQLHMLLDRVVSLLPGYAEMSRRQRKEVRALLKSIYRTMYEVGVEKPSPLA